MSSKTKKIIIWSSIAILFFMAIILGTIYDLQISKTLADLKPGQYYSKNLFAIIGETFGENILYVLLISALCILFFYFINNPIRKKALNIIILSIICLINYVICYYCLNKTLSYISTHTEYSLDGFLSSTLGKIVILMFSAIVCIVTFLLFSKVSKENIKKLWKWALIVIIVSALSNGIVQGAKLIFDRTRYRAMIYVGDTDFQFYDKWFVINNNKFNSVSYFAEDFFKSFPSGHTCAAASSFLLVGLPLFLPQINNKKWKIILWSFAVTYTFLVALSRIVAGAHFFMDVFVGGFTTIILTLIFYYLYNYKFMKQQKKRKCR